jgi:Type VI secretion system (T6SS), amidase effector protein 4
MSTTGKIAIDFDTLRKNYPVYKKLPPHLQNYIDSLNKGLKEGQPRNTPCCLQVSEALNGCGGDHKVPPRSHRRANPELPKGSGNYFLQAVDELENYLAAKYGAGEEIKTSSRKDTVSMKKYLNGKQGILCFRSGGAGTHTELWDTARILQDGAPSSSGAAMNQEYIFGQPRVVLWETTGASAPVSVVPIWLPGWWEVKDGFETYYYYFFPLGDVHYTRNRPERQYCPVTTKDSSGKFSADISRKLTIRWNVGELAVEVFTPLDNSNPPAMAGSYPDYDAPPFTAKKMAFP